MTPQSHVHLTVDRSGVVGRRGFLRAVSLGTASIGGLGFLDRLALAADDLRSRHMSMILLWMGGGPSQLETFDPKPDHPNGMGTKAIDTAVPGIRLAASWDKTAAQMKDICLIRSLTNKEGNHQRATYQVHTGYAPTASVKHPSFGAAVAHELGDPTFDLPQLVSIGRGRGQESGSGAGFLGTNYEPFHVDDPEKPPANTTVIVPRNRFERRLGLLEGLEKAGFGASGGADRVRDHQSLYKQTAGMVLSPRMKTFDLDSEPAELRDAYGRNPFGQGCLMARRLVETGVTFVEVRAPGNWDTHQDQADRLAELIPPVDAGFAALVNDLKTRGLLNTTLVVWMGEFGRTPKPNPNGGRDHFPRAFSAAVAGAGITGGRVVGATSPDGAEVTSDPVPVVDLLHTFCTVLKVDPTKENMSPIGRPLKIVDGGKPVSALIG